MSESTFDQRAEELDAVERDIAICREEIADLRTRTRVIEVESRSWRPASSRKPVPAENGAVLGFFVGLFGTILLALLARVLWS